MNRKLIFAPVLAGAALMAFPLAAQDAAQASSTADTAAAGTPADAAAAAPAADIPVGPVVLTATLAGANETTGGDTDGGGSFRAEMDAGTGDVCYTLAVSAIAPATAAHIHKGAAGDNGKPVIDLTVTGADSDACIAVQLETLKEVVTNPAGYYVNVHTADFPKGAVRGQLGK